MMSQGRELAHAHRADSLRGCFTGCCCTFLAVTFALIAGCQSPDDATVGGASGSSHRRAGPLPELSTYSFRYTDTPPVFDVADLKFFLKEFRRQVVILDLWASWSRSGREELAILADLKDELSDQGLRIVAVNFDPPEAWTDRTVPILLGAQANFPCVLVRQEAREELRRWLAPEWNYDLPARFILDRRGRIVARSLGDAPITSLLAEARQQVATKLTRRPMPDMPEIRTVARRTSPRLSPEARLVNVASGEWESVSLSAADSSNPARLADRIVSYIKTRLNRANNDRIAILPFLSDADRGTTGTAGHEVAEKVRRSLREHGYFDLVGAGEALRLISQAGISATAIEANPSIVRGRLAVDYLVIGRIAGASADEPGRQTLAATDDGAGD